MFSTSTQKKHWIFPDEKTIVSTREEVNRSYVDRFPMPEDASPMPEEEKNAFFLSAEEEKTLLYFYDFQLKDFCFKFQPPMPRSVVSTAFHYFKRFYLHHSVMDYHPKNILVTCVYLACKIEEFNINMSQFVANVRGDREKATEIILNNELLLMSTMKFHLTVHNPYRPVEGFLIDIKTRYPHLDAEALRPAIEEFLDKVMSTDIPLLYAPSQIALASILEAAKKCRQNLEPYVTQVLIPDEVMLPPVIEAVRTIRKMARVNQEIPTRESVRELEKKLEKCRNQENNPDSTIYKSRMKEDSFDDGDLSHDSFNNQ